jgi:hypothetical protein
MLIAWRSLGVTFGMLVLAISVFGVFFRRGGVVSRRRFAAVATHISERFRASSTPYRRQNVRRKSQQYWYY